MTTVLTLLISSFVLSACSILPGSGSSKTVNLEYWGLWESQNTVESVIIDYKKVNPNVNITYKVKSPQQYRESLQNQIQSGSGPDIITFHNTWTPMMKSDLDPVPSDVLSQSDLKKNYYPTVANDLVSGGKLMGVPLEYDGLALYYNEDILKAAGITRPPSTWTEFANDAIKMTVKDQSGNIRTAGASVGTATNIDHFSDILGMMILQNGGDLKSPVDKQTADTLEYYTNFAKGNNRVWDEAQPNSTVAFTGGNLAMYFAPSWRAFEIKNANPLLKFKTAPVPQLEGNKVTWATYWATGVNAKSANKKEAWDFVKYLTQDDTLTKMYTEAAKSPGRFFGEPYPKITLAQKLASDPIVGAFITDAPYARSFSMASRTFDNGLNDQIIKAYEDAVNITIKGTPASAALKTASQNITNTLQKFNAPAK